MDLTTSSQTASIATSSTNQSQGQPLSAANITGGCLCGQLCYEAKAPPNFAGTCSCNDCRRSSGSGTVGFMGFAGEAFRFTGETMPYHTTSLSGHNVVRNHCSECEGLVFGRVTMLSGGIVIFAGSLDDPSSFKPTTAIFNRSRPVWAPLPEGVQVSETMPG